jgi:hypothetical protein
VESGSCGSQVKGQEFIGFLDEPFIVTVDCVEWYRVEIVLAEEAEVLEEQ